MASEHVEDDEDFGDFDDGAAPAFKGLKLEENQGPSADDDDTVKSLKAKIASDSGNADLHAQLGKALLDLGADEQAAAAYDAATKLAPTNAAFQHGKARAQISGANWHEAEETLNAALKLDANNADILYDLGWCYKNEDNHARAREYFQQATAANPAHARALSQVAQYAQNDGNTEEAIKLYKAAVAANSKLVSAYQALGNLLQAKGDVQAASEHFSKAVALDPSEPQHYAKLLQAYDNLGNSAGFEATHKQFQEAFSKGKLNKNFLAVGRYNAAQFESGDKFVMVFDHFVLMGDEATKYAFIVYKKGEVREDKILFRVSLVVKGGSFSLHSFDSKERKHYKDYAAEPDYFTLKGDVNKVLDGSLAATSTAPFSF